MSKYENVDFLLKAAGRNKEEHQQIRQLYCVDGIDCFEPIDDDPNFVNVVLPYDTADLKKWISEENNAKTREAHRATLERVTKIKVDFLLKKYPISASAKKKMEELLTTMSVYELIDYIDELYGRGSLENSINQ